MHRWKPLRQMKATDPDITSVLMPCDLNQPVQHGVHLRCGLVFVLLQQRATGKAQEE